MKAKLNPTSKLEDERGEVTVEVPGLVGHVVPPAAQEVVSSTHS
jgi:hypothetical protein